jgi:hypothetical protein
VNQLIRQTFKVPCHALLLFLLATSAYAQGSGPQIGREVAIPVHLRDGTEFSTPIPQLI